MPRVARDLSDSRLENQNRRQASPSPARRQDRPPEAASSPAATARQNRPLPPSATHRHQSRPPASPQHPSLAAPATARREQCSSKSSHHDTQRTSPRNSPSVVLSLSHLRRGTMSSRTTSSFPQSACRGAKHD